MKMLLPLTIAALLATVAAAQQCITLSGGCLGRGSRVFIEPTADDLVQSQATFFER